MSIPVGVKQAVMAIWATLAISALGAVLATRLGYTSAGELSFTLVLYALFCIIPYKISNGSNPARYVYLVLCCMSALLMLAGVSDLSKPDIVSSAIQLPLMIFAIFRLFQQPSGNWFSARHPSSSQGSRP